VRDWPKDRLLTLYRSEIYRDDAHAEFSVAHAPLPGHILADAIPFMIGRRPAWNNRYSPKWIYNVLGEWRPDVIYSFFYHESIPRYAEWLSQLLGCPYVVHIGDDSPALTTASDIPGIFQRASRRIAISEEMATEYQQRYNAAFDVLHNGASEDLFVDTATDTVRDDTFVVRYIGSLLREQHWHAIEDFVEAVKIVNRGGRRVRFEIYCDKWTKRLAEELADGDQIVYAGFAEKPRNYELLKSADLLLLPVTFSDQFLQGYRFSMPTKLCEYLASGAPTLVYGPRGPAVVEFCARHGVGIVQTTRSTSALVDLLNAMTDDSTSFREAAVQSRVFAQNRLSAQSMSVRFRELMEAALGSDATS
jgi:glycosyltransferase involved in cell wall biosynthesis